VSNSEDNVMAAVANALRENPAASVAELFELAKGVSPAVAELSTRQFHARYPLQIKRKLAPPRKRGPGRKKTGLRREPAKPADTGVREAVRTSILKFAQDLAAAEARKDVVKVVAGVDRYVDEILRVTGGA